MINFLWKKISLLPLLLFLCIYAKAQHGNALQFLSNISQSSRINPAFQNKTDKLVVGLPLLSGTSVNWESNTAINDFNTDDFSFDYENFYNSLNKPGTVFALAQVPVIFLSLKKKNHTFGFEISEKIIGTTDFDEEILNFFAQGLQPYYEKNEQIGPVSLKSKYYREVAFAYANEIWKGFSVGIRPKILFGKLYYKANNIDVNVSTDTEAKTLKISPEGNFTISGPVKVIRNIEKDNVLLKPDVKPIDYLFKLKNMGAGFDLGITYKINKQTEISVSILDIGFTSFKNKAYDIVFTESLNYQQNSLYQSHDPTTPMYQSPQYSAKQISDTISYITDVYKVEKRVIEALPFQINTHIKYKLTNSLQIGTANHYTYYNNYSSNVFSGFVHSYFGEKFEAAATLNLYNMEKMMPGIGASYNDQSVQYYISTNNIFALLHPYSAKNLNLCFGVNFLFPTN